MNAEFLKTVASTAKLMQVAANRSAPLPTEVTAPPDQPIIPHVMFKDAPSYIQKVAYQVNACYMGTAYDGCAVMMRRLIEVLIIDSFEKHGRGSVITGANNHYLFLDGLVSKCLAEKWPQKLGRNVVAGLADLKTIGDQSAHSRHYNAHKSYIDEQKIVFRTVIERLLFLSGHKK